MLTEHEKEALHKVTQGVWDRLTEDERQAISPFCNTRSVADGEMLYRQGEVPEFIHAMASGQIILQHTEPQQPPQIIRMVEPGGIFGFHDAIRGGVYSCDAFAGTDSVVATLPVDKLVWLLNHNASVAYFFTCELSVLLDRAVCQTVALTQKHLRGRLAEALLSLKAKYGTKEDGTTINIPLPRAKLAQMSNMNTNNAIRTLSAFAKEGLVAVDKRDISILDDAKLRYVSLHE